MADYKVSIRYAASLLEMAVEKNVLDPVSKDMELIFSALEENPQLNRMMQSPVIKPQIKAAIMDEIFKLKVDKDSMDFIQFVIDKSREPLLHSIVKKFLELRDEHIGQINAKVQTAFEFTDEQKQQLKIKLENLLNKKVELKFIIDKNIIGGFIAKVGDTVYDASVSHQLELLKKQFLEGSFSLN